MDSPRPAVETQSQPPETGQEAQLARALLIVALLGALVYHGGLSLYGTYQNTYDAYVHIFFADHWTHSWFDHWDTRWYTGFPLTSYPPLSQQSVAFLSFFIGDLRHSFAVVQTAAMLTMTVGMYRFARLWVSDEAAGWAAIWLVFSSAMAETIHVFGQLPTTFSLGLLLNALPYTYRWIDEGRPGHLARSWALTAATTGAHHVTTLFGSVFITAPVILLALVQHFRTALPDEPGEHPPFVTKANWRGLVMRRLRRILPATLRAGLFGGGTGVLLVLVVLPYWLWSASDPITQVSIPHASRDNFLVNTAAGLVFWLIPYGMLLFTFPYVFFKGAVTKAWPLTASIALLALLGTGGTTPIPKLLLRGAFDILTLDRFTLWASILMLPLAGEFVVSLRRRTVAAWTRAQFGDLTWRGVQLFFAVGLLAASIFTVSLTQFRRFQPEPIEIQPILNFLEKDQHWRWRYLTLGFGDQMAWLSANTRAAQVDGNYHSARRLPELTTTPVERLEGAKFRGIPGIGSLQQFLNVPDKFDLKYVFSNDQFYDPLLYFYGWHRVQYLENGIAVWEREDIPVLPEVLPRREIPLYQRLMFGILPPAALLAALLAVSAGWWTIPLRLLAEMLGLQRLAARLPRMGWPAPLTRLWDGLDRRLRSASALPANGDDAAPPWQLWLRYAWLRSSQRFAPANAQARHLRTVVLALGALALLVWGALWWQNRQTGPERIVQGWYDDLDFRRFGEAYQRLNPKTRPDFEQFMLELSVQSGLVASYAKLENLETTVLRAEADRMQIQADARYITALSYYTDTVTFTLSRLPDAGWVIEPRPVDIRVPPEQFQRQTAVEYLSAGRRRVSNAVTDFADVLDRPELDILSAELLLTKDGRFVLVGELMNTDVDPADVTVTGLIYDGDGEMLTWYNAGAGMIHKILPLEITPFRIDFEGVAGLALEEAAASLSFTPGAYWDFLLPPDVALGNFTVFAKAVVTGRDLGRSLGVQHLRVVETADGLALEGELINSGLDEAVIPHLLVTLYDEAGRVRWVDHHFLREGVRSQRALPFRLPVTPSAESRSLGLPGNVYSNILAEESDRRDLHADAIPLPPGHGYAHLRVSVHYYAGGR